MEAAGENILLPKWYHSPPSDCLKTPNNAARAVICRRGVFPQGGRIRPLLITPRPKDIGVPRRIRHGISWWIVLWEANPHGNPPWNFVGDYLLMGDTPHEGNSNFHLSKFPRCVFGWWLHVERRPLSPKLMSALLFNLIIPLRTLSYCLRFQSFVLKVGSLFRTPERERENARLWEKNWIIEAGMHDYHTDYESSDMKDLLGPHDPYIFNFPIGQSSRL